MIACPICQIKNHHLAVVCVACGSFLQSTIKTLDLFTTVWRLVESPQKAFHHIAMASHKNYVFVLGALSGIGFVFMMFWLIGIGNSGIPLLNILAAGFVLGPVLGVANFLLLAFIQKIVAMIFRLTTKYKNALAIVAYACVPIALSVIFILPIEILTYGKYLFSTNPSPWTLKPLSYIVLLGLDGVFFMWSLVLYALGVRVLYDIPLARALIISNGTVALFAVIVGCVVVLISWCRFVPDVEKYFTLLFK